MKKRCVILVIFVLIGLSLLGMRFYTIQMNRYRANKILDMASETAFVAQTLNGGRGGMACTGCICNSSDGVQTGFVWVVTADILKFVASADKDQGIVTVILTGDLSTGSIPANIQDALVAIAEADDSVTYKKPSTLILKTQPFGTH